MFCYENDDDDHENRASYVYGKDFINLAHRNIQSIVG